MTSRLRNEWLPLYPLGLLNEEERRLVESEVSADAAVAREFDEFCEVAGLLALAAPAISPPAALRSRLECARPPRPLLVEAEPGIFVHRASDQHWTATPFAGVFVKQMAFDPERSVATSLIRMEPGAEYPNHTHTQEEQCYVISGDIVLGTVELRTGDYSRAAEGSRHGRVFTRNGCMLLITACTHDELG
ncbi:MAG: cupin domain-containing protein [Acidobacteria bacterium]|nr:cupin domain-containing protein [Acidobacteriota bacterium]